MKDESIYSIEMEKRVVDIKNDPLYQAEIIATPASLDYFTRAEGYCTTSLDWQQKLKRTSKAYTVAGVDIKEVVAKYFSITAATMSAYGEKIGNSDLVALKATYTYSNLFRKKAEDMVADCNYILGLISLHTVPLAGYKIDAVYTANLQALAAQLDALTKLPANVIKQHASDLIQYEEHEKLVKKFYDKEMDSYMGIYRIADIDLYLAYTAARQVRHHHLKRKPKEVDTETTTGILEILAVLKDTMEPAVGANFLALVLNISELTDPEGETYNDELVPGTYEGILHLDGYQTITFSFTIEAGKTTALQFLMEKEVAIPVPPVG